MNQKFDKFLGEYFDDVIYKLSNQGYLIQTEEVKPYEDMVPSGKKRIIDIRQFNNNKLKIIWSHENYN